MTLPTSIVARPSIDIAHQRIHEGNHFAIHKIVTGIVTPTKYFLIIPPPPLVVGEIVEMHIAFQVYSDIGGTLQFFENPIITSNGTALTIINNNRRSSTTSEVNIFEDPIVTSDGTLLFEERRGTITTNDIIIGEFERDEEEFVLDPISMYILKYIPLTIPLGGVNITMEINWYDNRPSSPAPL